MTATADAEVQRLAADVVAAHQASVWRYLRFLGCSAEEADDLAQETFVVWLRSERGIEPAAIDAWLRGVARNLFRAQRRALRRGLATLDPEQIEAMWCGYARDDAGDGYQSALRACLAELDDRARHALELRYADGATRRSIAAELGVAEEGAKTLLRRVKARLRKCIERRLSDERA